MPANSRWDLIRRLKVIRPALCECVKEEKQEFIKDSVKIKVIRYSKEFQQTIRKFYWAILIQK